MVERSRINVEDGMVIREVPPGDFDWETYLRTYYWESLVEATRLSIAVRSREIEGRTEDEVTQYWIDHAVGRLRACKDVREIYGVLHHVGLSFVA